jgi:formylglycine-generating enzyme required for sulfatase activity
MGARRSSLEAIQEAFLDAFTLESLERMVRLKLGKDLWDYAAKDDKRQVVFELLDGARREGFLDRLMAGARAFLPDSEKLAALLPTREGEERYLKWLVSEADKKARLYSALQGIGETRSRDLADEEENQHIALLRHWSPRQEVQEYDDILKAFGKVKRAALLGAPGAGKSTTLRKLALELGRKALEDEREPLPVLVDLCSWTGDEGLWRFLAAEERVPWIGWAAEELVREGRLLLLLDGLNEMPPSKWGAKAEEVKQIRDVPLVVSCRLEDYTGELDLELDKLTLEPLSPQRIRAALRLWERGEAAGDEIFWELAGDARLGKVFEEWLNAGLEEASFWTPSDLEESLRRPRYEDYTLWRRHMSNPRNLLRLAANPFLLRMLYQVRGKGKELPRNRGELFRGFILSLLSREGLREKGALRPTEEGNRLLGGLEKLAWEMQRVGACTADSGALSTPRAKAKTALIEEKLLKKAVGATILEGDGEVRFRHQLLQEYFAAGALQGRFREMAATELWLRKKWWERSGWEETAVLLAGLHAQDCTPVIRWLRDAQPEVAAQCFLESGAEVAGREELLRELQAAWLPRLTDEEREPERGRAAIGRAVGRLRLDNRKGVGLRADGVPEIDWVEIPGGEFIYQEGERRRSKTFWMARYPVTNAQYQAFLEAKDGYGNDRWWQGLTDPDRTPVSPEWSEGNHPREMVNWCEAMAFGGWLSDKLGFEVRLPTECEWERAARETEGRVYPWGNEYEVGRANVDRSIGRTSAVGIYPQGASVEGVLDLSGNVWEWCLNEYGKPKRTRRSGTECRVLRGGSWSSSRGFARAVVRYGDDPDVRDSLIGFRVVCSSPIR